MPTYEYECQDCTLRFEKYQNITAKPLRACPDCGGKVRRLIGAGAAIISKSAAVAECGLSPMQCPRGNSRCGRDVPCDMMSH